MQAFVIPPSSPRNVARKKIPRMNVSLQKVPGVARQNKQAFCSNMLRHLKTLHLLYCHLLGRLKKLKTLQRKSKARAACATTATANKSTLAGLKDKMTLPAFFGEARTSYTNIQTGVIPTGPQQVKQEKDKDRCGRGSLMHGFQSPM